MEIVVIKLNDCINYLLVMHQDSEIKNMVRIYKIQTIKLKLNLTALIFVKT